MGHRLQLNDLLIKPVQRIMKYQLLLKVKPEGPLLSVAPTRGHTQVFVVQHQGHTHDRIRARTRGNTRAPLKRCTDCAVGVTCVQATFQQERKKRIT